MKICDKKKCIPIRFSKKCTIYFCVIASTPGKKRLYYSPSTPSSSNMSSPAKKSPLIGNYFTILLYDTSGHIILPLGILKGSQPLLILNLLAGLYSIIFQQLDLLIKFWRHFHQKKLKSVFPSKAGACYTSYTIFYFLHQILLFLVVRMF